jgi:hypothetical protein
MDCASVVIKDPTLKIVQIVKYVIKVENGKIEI